ncbi:diguanylate cyclase [Rhizobium laguerreae]|uniref:GGDEF domain-containing protein n=1 Tax=Rhizobium laguerreae TaxID=1076926 RepID=UPI001C926314|nr:sensor domain-containing diguanylate cyclase [Rhizobium laguerreae]MBY3153812.1 diguanylate cyclase [Rhizobium laguerreae]
MFLDEDHEAFLAAQLTKETLVDTQARMGMMLDLMPMGLLIHTRQGIIFGNQEASRLLQVPQDQVVGRHFLDFLQTQIDEAAQQMDEAFKGRICENSTEADIRAAEGTVRTIKLIAGALPWDGNPVVQLLLQDITDLKTIQNALHRLTITDELTGAFNRRHAFAVANRFFDSTRPGSHALAVAVLDIDHFKRVNDTHGHAAGDAALRTLSQTVRELISTLQFDGSTFARVGGEEFLLLLPEMESDAVIAACEHVRCAIEQQPIVTASGVFYATVSIGVAIRRPTDGSFDTVFSNADRALYRAKESGRNRVCIDEETLQSRQRLTATK